MAVDEIDNFSIKIVISILDGVVSTFYAADKQLENGIMDADFSAYLKLIKRHTFVRYEVFKIIY